MFAQDPCNRARLTKCDMRVTTRSQSCVHLNLKNNGHQFQIKFTNTGNTEDPRTKDPQTKNQGPRFLNPRTEDPQTEYPRIKDPRIEDPVHGLEFCRVTVEKRYQIAPKFATSVCWTPITAITPSLE